MPDTWWLSSPHGPWAADPRQADPRCVWHGPNTRPAAQCFQVEGQAVLWSWGSHPALPLPDCAALGRSPCLSGPWLPGVITESASQTLRIYQVASTEHVPGSRNTPAGLRHYPGGTTDPATLRDHPRSPDSQTQKHLDRGPVFRGCLFLMGHVLMHIHPLQVNHLVSLTKMFFLSHRLWFKRAF